MTRRCYGPSKLECHTSLSSALQNHYNTENQQWHLHCHENLNSHKSLYCVRTVTTTCTPGKWLHPADFFRSQQLLNGTRNSHTYGTQRFTENKFMKAHTWFISWSRLIHCTSSYFFEIHLHINLPPIPRSPFIFQTKPPQNNLLFLPRMMLHTPSPLIYPNTAESQLSDLWLSKIQFHLMRCVGTCHFINSQLNM
jgi:hypothetical protein